MRKEYLAKNKTPMIKKKFRPSPGELSPTNRLYANMRQVKKKQRRYNRRKNHQAHNLLYKQLPPYVSGKKEGLGVDTINQILWEYLVHRGLMLEFTYGNFWAIYSPLFDLFCTNIQKLEFPSEEETELGELSLVELMKNDKIKKRTLFHITVCDACQERFQNVVHAKNENVNNNTQKPRNDDRTPELIISHTEGCKHKINKKSCISIAIIYKKCSDFGINNIIANFTARERI